MAEEDPRTIFLLGAGASKLVGIPLINEMTQTFLANPTRYWDASKTIIPKLGKQIPSALRTLSKIAKTHYFRMDLEYLMTLVHELEDDHSRQLFESKYPALKKQSRDTIAAIKRLVNRHIRGACEDFAIDNVNYLWSLPGLSSNGKMKIFTLNYDGSIEIFCDRKGLSYSDGFDPYWRPKVFEDVDIKIFKLHGSLYWLKSESGRPFKVPLKGLDVDKVSYLTDEEVSEMMIYPALEKNKQSEVYLWLFRKFIDELNDSRTCVVIGYSFRDKEILDNIIDAINRNQELWLVIVDPIATRLKKLFFNVLDEDTCSRIVPMDLRSKEAITDRVLHKFLLNLQTVKKREGEIWGYQSRMRVRLDRDWTWVLNNYAEINHYDRIALIYDRLSKQEFENIDGNASEVIENFLGPLSLQCLTEFYNNDEIDRKPQLWSFMFLEYCKVMEHAYFEGNSLIATSNPFKESDLPHWRLLKGFDGDNSKPTRMKASAELFKKYAKAKDKKLEQYLSKFIETFDLFTFKKDPDNPKSDNLLAVEFLGKYKEQNLGLYKWASKIVDHLYRNWV